MKVSILTIILVTNILFFSYALPTDNESDKVTYSPPALTAVADAGPDTTLTCVVNTVTLEGINTSMGPEFTYEWTDENGNVIGTDPAVEVFEPGEFILSVTNTNTSFEDMDTTIVTLNFDEVEFSIIDPEFLTCTNSAVLIDLVLNDPNTNATFSWEGPGGGGLSTEEDLVATLSGEYTVIVTNAENGCSVMESVAVFENTSFPIAVALVQQELSCTQTVVLLEGDSDDPNASFEWRNDAGFVISNDQNAEVAEPGVYTLTVTNLDNGCNASDEVVVVSNQEEEETINVPPITTSESSITLDIREFIDIDLGLEAWDIEWTFPDGSQTISNNPTLEINQTGIYTCIATNPINGCATTLIYTVNFMTILVADAGPDQTLTCDVNAVTLGGPNTTTGQNISYIWTDESGNQISGAFQTDVFQAGQYTLTVNDVSTGEMAIDVVIVTENIEVPDLSISPSPTITCFTPTATLVATVSNVDPSNAIYAWETFDGNILSDPSQASIIVDQGGVYTLTIFNSANNCIAEEIVDVNVEQENQTEVQPTISSTTPTYIIDPSNFIQDPNCTYAWTMQAGLTVTNFPLAEISQVGTYTFVKTDSATGCTTSFIYTVQFVSGTVADAGPDVEITCNNPNATIGSNNTSVGPNFIYEWTGLNGNVIGTTPFIEVFEPGIYTLSVFNTTDNTFATDMVSVLIDGVVPSINIPTPGVLDCNNTVVTLQGFSSIGTNVTFEWSALPGNIVTATDQPNVDVDEPGVYILTVTNLINGCSSAHIVEVFENVDGGSFDIEPTQSSVYPITIIADEFPNNLNLNLTWEATAGLTPIDDTTAEISQPGQYTFVATNLATGCDYNYIYTVYDNVLADAGETQSLTCVVGSVTIGGVNTSTGANIDYEWHYDNGSQIANSSTVEVFEAGLYTLIVTDLVTGESIQDQVLVAEDFEAPNFIFGPVAPLTFENPLITINTTLFTPDAADATFAWFDSSGTLVSTEEDLEVDIAGVYTLAVTNTISGCLVEAAVVVEQNFDSETIPLESIVASAFPITLDPTEIVEDTSGIIHTPYPLERSSDFEFKWIEREGLVVTDFPLAEVSQTGLYAFLRRDISTGFVTRYEYNIDSDASTPIADAGEIVINCINVGNSFTLGGPNTSTGPEFTYQWTDQNGAVFSTEKNPTVTEIGFYTLTVTNTNTGEMATDASEIEEDLVEPFVFIVAQGSFDCVTDTITLIANIDIPVEEATFEWTTTNGTIFSDPTLPSILIGDQGVYELTVTNLQNGCLSSSLEGVGPGAGIVFFQEIDNEITCEETRRIDPCLELINSTQFPCQGFWEEQEGLTIEAFPIAIADRSGEYNFNITDDNGCIEAIAVFTVEISEPLVLEFIINDNNQLEALVTGGTGEFTYDWNVDADSAIIDNPINGTEYELTVTDANGCALSDSFTFVIDAIFTPAAKEISVSPNPTDGLLHLDLDKQSIQQVTQLQIFDVKGVAMSLDKELLSGSRITLNLGNLQAGMYILHAVIGGEFYYQKVIVQ